jgi:hypothetical protein
VLFDAQHLAVTGKLRSDRHFDGPVVRTAVDRRQHGEARRRRLDAVIALHVRRSDFHARPLLRLGTVRGPFLLRLRRRTRRPCVLRARDGAIGLTEGNAAGEIGELFVRACREGLDFVLQVLHLPRQARHKRAEFGDLFERMRLGFLRFEPRTRFVRTVLHRRLQIDQSRFDLRGLAKAGFRRQSAGRRGGLTGDSACRRR